MSWQKTKISEFLTERTDRFKPDKANELGLPRIEKIDFSGTIYINNFKPTKTGMILVKDGDLVISGINVEKGALSIYKGETDALATIHYSSYTYDENKIDIEYLKWYLQSNIFCNILKEQVKSGIKTEIKPKTFLNLEIMLPDLTTQKQIASKLNKLEWNVKDLDFTCFCNNELIYKLRQSILQDAIQGKLVPQDPTDEPASELLKKIKEKKEQLIKEGKIKKEKNIQLPVNKNSEIPNGWIICALGEIGNAIDSPIVDGPFGSSINTNTDYISNGVPVIRMMNIKPLNYIGNNLKFVSENKFNGLKRHNVIPNDILFSKVGAGIGECCIYPATEKEGMLSTTGVIRFRVGEMVISKYLCYFLLAKKDYFLEIASQTAQPFLNMTMIKNTEFLLPPKEEQKRIVARLDELMQLCDKLENENSNAQKFSSELLQSIMQKYFTPEV